MCSNLIGCQNWWSHGHPKNLGQMNCGILVSCGNQYCTGTGWSIVFARSCRIHRRFFPYHASCAIFSCLCSCPVADIFLHTGRKGPRPIIYGVTIYSCISFGIDYLSNKNLNLLTIYILFYFSGFTMSIIFCLFIPGTLTGLESPFPPPLPEVRVLYGWGVLCLYQRIVVLDFFLFSCGT